MAEPDCVHYRFDSGRVEALVTTRRGGVSRAPYDSWNLAAHVGDVSSAVSENRARLLGLLPAGVKLCWLNQEHGTAVVHAAAGAGRAADAVWTDDSQYAGVVMTADCLPVVFAADDGRCAAVAHAGWRGLVGGVLGATVSAMPTPVRSLSVWLGPAIGPEVYEVGDDVRHAAMGGLGEGASAFFRAQAQPGKWLCDLYGLARLQLKGMGITRIHGGDRCTASEATEFFSHRRDGVTGRMATVVWLAATQ